MNARRAIETVGLALVVLLMLPTLVHTLLNPQDPTNAERATDAAAKAIEAAVTPWWLDPVVLLGGLGAFGALCILGLFYLMRRGDLPDW